MSKLCAQSDISTGCRFDGDRSAEKIIAGTLSLLAAALAAIQTLCNFAAKAKAHRAAAAQFEDIRRRCEFVLFRYHLIPDGLKKARFAIDQYEQLIARQTDLAASSPDAAKYSDRAWNRTSMRTEERHKSAVTNTRLGSLACSLTKQT